MTDEATTSSVSTADVPRETIPAVENVSAVLDRVMESFEAVECTQCRNKFSRRIGADVIVCAPCLEQIERRAEAREIHRRFPTLVLSTLRSAGLSPREATADFYKIPEGLRTVLWTDERIRADLERMSLGGEIPIKGFGLSGETGTGKTFMLAALMKTLATARVQRRYAEDGKKALSESWLAWVSWPMRVLRYRAQSMEDGGMAKVRKDLQALAEKPALVLDDLGVERFVGGGSYENDWIATQLDALVDARYGLMKPTWFTTNLVRGEFVNRYGSRLFSRLCADNPFVRVPSIADLRSPR